MHRKVGGIRIVVGILCLEPGGFVLFQISQCRHSLQNGNKNSRHHHWCDLSYTRNRAFRLRPDLMQDFCLVVFVQQNTKGKVGFFASWLDVPTSVIVGDGFAVHLKCQLGNSAAVDAELAAFI